MSDREYENKQLSSVEGVDDAVLPNPKTAKSLPLATKSLASKRILLKRPNRIEDPLLVALRQRG
jgi:hypothetical protein